MTIIEQQCPHCNQKFKVPFYAYSNADNYSESCRVTTECCGKIVHIRPIRRFEITKDKSNLKVDDWGTPAIK